MQSELSRSQFAHDTLKESTAALNELGERYSTLDTLLSSSRNLLGTLMRSQKSDTWYLETAFYILLATIAWLVFRRFVYGPAWWFVYLPLKLFYKAWMGVFTVMGIRGSRDGVFATTETVQTTRPSLIVHKSATGKAQRGWPANGKGPSVVVGGGGRGQHGPHTPVGQPGGMVDQVGKIIDESKTAATYEVKQDAFSQAPIRSKEQAPSNPKKRMWEENVEVEREGTRRKDEL